MIGDEKNIVVVDDDDSILEMLSERLQDFIPGVIVHCYDNTELALEELEYSGDEIDLIITDYNVPELNGDGLAKKAKEFTDCPIILFSGNSSVVHSAPEELFKIAIVKDKPLQLIEEVKELLGIS